MSDAALDRPAGIGAFSIPDDIAALKDEFSKTTCENKLVTLNRCTIDTRALDCLLPVTLTAIQNRMQVSDVAMVNDVGADGAALPVPGILEANHAAAVAPVDLIDLSFLHALRAQNDKFIPTEPILVRDCMRHLFRLFHGVTASCYASRAVLVGSPGVGKSLLLLMAAVYKARTMPVIYFRETRSCDYMTAFVTYRCQDDDAITSSSNSRIDVLQITNLDIFTGRLNIWKLLSFLKDTILKGVDRSDYLIFTDDLFRDSSYDFFCSSEGHRCFKNDEMDRKLWILDAWSREEAARYLHDRHGADMVNRAYDLCGGNIRGMIRACRDYDDTYRFWHYLSFYISLYTPIPTVCFVHVRDEKEMHNYPIPNDFFAMFHDKRADDGDWADDRMRPIQYVDSPFALNHLVELLNVGVLYRTFKASLQRHQQMQRLYYKRLIHQWFTLMVKPGTDAAKRIDGINDIQWHTKPDAPQDDSSAMGLNQLATAGVLWISGISNDANVDAAIVHHTTLHVFEYVAGDRHTFDVDAFQHGCLGDLVDHFPSLDRHVKVHFVTPTERESWQGLGLDGSHNFDCFFTPSVVRQEQQQNYQPDAPKRAREVQHEPPTAPLRFHVSFHVHQLDVCARGISVENVGDVCWKFFSKLFMEHTNQPLDTHHPLR